MKIIVVGDGKVGFAIAKQLNQEGHDITVVENKSSVLSSTMNQLDIVGVQGNGASLDTLMEARVSSSDLLIRLHQRMRLILFVVYWQKIGRKTYDCTYS